MIQTLEYLRTAFNTRQISSRGWNVGWRQNTILDSSTVTRRLGASTAVTPVDNDMLETHNIRHQLCLPSSRIVLHFFPRQHFCIDNTRLPLDIIILKYPLTIGHLDLPRYESFTSPLRICQLTIREREKKNKSWYFHSLFTNIAGKKYELHRKNRLKLKSFRGITISILTYIWNWVIKSWIYSKL